MKDLAVVTSGLSKRLGTVQALTDVDLEVEWGEVVALVGPNGAGKTTLIRVLSTIVLPDSGRVEVAGHDVVRDGAGVRRAVGLDLGGERAWYWRLTGRQNLEFFAALGGAKRSDAKRVATTLLHELGLGDVGDRRVGRFSTGMRARLSLARALLGSPRVLLLDEPTASIDPVSAAGFRDRLRALARERSLGVLVSTHDLVEAAAADRVVALSHGRVAFSRSGAVGAEELALELALAATP
jgi:ABC-2 type transport system ATP-binding protein